MFDLPQTQERAALATFTTAFAVDNFLLVTLATPKSKTHFKWPRTWDPMSMIYIFQPLLWDVWVIHSAMTIFAGLLICLMEATPPDLSWLGRSKPGPAGTAPSDDFEVEAGGNGGKGGADPSSEGGGGGEDSGGGPKGDGQMEEKEEEEEEGEEYALTLGSFVTSVYAAWHHFLWSGPFHEDLKTVGGKLALGAFGFHVVILTASYTGP